MLNKNVAEDGLVSGLEGAPIGGMSSRPLTLIIALVVLGASALLLLPDKGGMAEAAPAMMKTEGPARISEEFLHSYAELSFDEVYRLPVGPLGLDYTERCLALNGAQVRMEGHMVKHCHDDPCVFLFSPVPAMHNQMEYMLADSLPVSLVHVIMKVRPGDAPSWRPQRITVMGRLELGPRQEVDGRVSHIRLFCEQVADSKTLAPVELRRPLALQRDRLLMQALPHFRPTRTEHAATPTSTRQETN